MASDRDKLFRHIMRDRILVEMLRASKNAGGGSGWKVLITDSFTVRVIGHSCKMTDVTEEGISLVEDLNRRRQPQPSMDALYFIQPSQLSLKLFQNDMQGREPLYKRAHVFFSRPLPKDFLQVIKNDPQLRARIAALREMNLEVLTVDMQGFVTDNGDALRDLFRSTISSRDYERTIHEVATRLGTVFASLMEFPAVRYKAAKVSSAGAGSPQRMRDMVPSKLAAALWERICKYKADLKDFPQKDTCDLIIVDRTLDPVSPFIHDWSYGGMVYDLLPVDGNKYEYETAGKSGKREKKTVLLDEHDPVWLEVRDLFLAKAYNKVNEIFKQISAKTTAKEGDMSTSEMQQLIQNAAKYGEHKEKVELHIKMSSELTSKLKAEGLFDVGTLEQGFVFGDNSATYKELSQMLKDHEDDMSPYSKLRLLLVYAATHPDKLDAAKVKFWTDMASLGPSERDAIANLELLGVPLAGTGAAKEAGKDGPGAFGLAFGALKGKSGARRKAKVEDDEGYELSKFYPLLQDILEESHAGTLSPQDFPYVQEPSASPSSSAFSAAPAPAPAAAPPPTSSFGAASGGFFNSLLGGSSTPAPPKAAPAPASADPAASAAGGALAGKPGLSVRKRGSVRADGVGGSASGAGASGGSTSAGGNFSSGSSLASWALKGKEGASTGAAAAGGGSSGSLSGGSTSSSSTSQGSVRGTSARGGSTSSLAAAAGNLSISGRGKGRRLFVFVIGGMTRSEVRVAHVLSKKLNREVIIGSTSIETPIEFIEKLKALNK